MNNKDNWIYFFDSFADLCELSCKEIQYNHYYPLFKFDSSYRTAINLRISLIYNVKHLIEIYIKSIIRMIGSDEDIKTHRLDNIFIKLKKILEPKIEKCLPEMNEKFKDYLEQEIKEWKEERYFVEIQEIIEYYNELKFLDNSQTIKDSQNTFFKYPEDASAGCHKVNYYDFIYNNDFDVRKIEEDVSKLQLSLHSIKMIFM
jgi:hypothetical protein